MDRKISLNDVRVAVDEAYENYKSIKDGKPDERIEGIDVKDFGISVVLTDGTTINKADTQKHFALGQIVKLPTHVVLLQQNSIDKLLDKSGYAKGKIKKPENLGLSAHGIRAVSAITPANDPEGKWDIMISNIINMTGNAPVLDDKLYKRLSGDALKAGVEDKLAQDGFALYDNAAIAIDQYIKLMSLTVTAEELAVMGATIAADGRNPKTGEIAFDGELSAPVVTLAATHGPHKRTTAWMMETGLPAKSSFSGAILAILPGFGAIAVYAPCLCDECGVSVKAWKAIRYIANKLGLNVYSSARVKVE